MNLDQLRRICVDLPGVTEQIQWEDDLVFKVAGKMFAVAPLEPARLWLTLKADPEQFVELTERPGVIPAPYLARAKWIAIEKPDTLPPAEVEALLRKSYQLVVEKLPKSARQSLTSKAAGRKGTEKRAAKKVRKSTVRRKRR
jgi:predicted DNA-binding protein (MmcQ/YjbR family)